MATAIFIVIFARGTWWIDLNGEARGPYTTRDGAEQVGIGLASDFAKRGRRAEVQTAEPGQRNRMVWQSPDAGALGRAVASAHR